jgi:hypothetical protein
MIDILDFKNFLKKTFISNEVFYEEFKPELHFAEIDCFSEENYKIAADISNDYIKIGTISKKPSLDFSLYEYTFETNNKAEDFILHVKKNGIFPVSGPSA